MHYSQAAPAVAPAAGGPRTRASDADRDAAAALLGAAFAEGRLSAGEHEERLNAIYAARTWQQLGQLTGDLPAAADRAAGRGPAPGPAAELDRCLLCLVLCMCPPAGVAWWLRSRRRRSAGPGGQVISAGPGAQLSQEGQHAQDR